MGPLLFVVFIVVPLIELAVIIQVGQVVGAGWTIVALVTMSLLGAALVKREGLRAWGRLRTALDEARIPAAEVVDGALVLLAGALMVTPGFVTDALGLLLVVPLTRIGINRIIRSRTRSTFGLGPATPRRGTGPASRDDTVDVEVVDVRRDDGRGDGPGAADR